MAEQTDDAVKSIRDSDLDAFTTGLAFDSQKISEDTRNAFENSENFETVQESIKKPYSPARRKTIEEAVDKEVGEAAEAAAAKILDAAEAKEQEEFDIGSLPSKITEVAVERDAEVKKIKQQKSPKSSESETQEDGPKESSGFELVSAIKNFMVPEQEETETKKTEREQNTKNQEDDREALLSSSTARVARTSANTSSLSLLAAQYNSDSGGESDTEPSKKQEGPVKKPEKATAEKPADYREIEDDSDSSSSSSDSDVEFISHQQISNELAKIIDVDMLEEEEENTGKPKVPIKAKGELLLEDLPPIQDLHITVPEYECVELGKVNSIVDQLVLVDSIPGTVPLNLDTVLFLEKGSKVLGEVFDVLGQVSNPLYCVRFNSNAHIKEKGIELGQTVYVAPRSDHTKYVILPEILKLRGSDASWENDIEPSDKHLDYSDDEDERTARRSGGRNRDRPDEGDAPKRRRPTAAEQQQARSHHQYPRYQPRNPSQDRGGGGGGNILGGGGQYQPFPPQPPMATVPPPFAYNSASGSWHANYNQPPVFYPNPYARGPPFIPPEAMQQVLFPPPPPPGEQ